jgi:hypothetical protein
MNSSKLWVPRNAKALKCNIAANEGIRSVSERQEAYAKFCSGVSGECALPDQAGAKPRGSNTTEITNIRYVC